MVPLDLLRKICSDGDGAVLDANEAGVLAFGPAFGGGRVGVAKGDRAFEPLLEPLGGIKGGVGFLLEQRQMLRRQPGDLADRHGADVVEAGAVIASGRHHATSANRSEDSETEACFGFGRAMAR